MKQDPIIPDITAAILAGGRNTRFSGKTKAKIIIDGRPIIEHILEVLESVFSDIIIITNNKEEFKEYEHIRMAGDIYHNIGPLGGLHSALRNTGAGSVFMVASDMPGLSAGIIKQQVDEYSLSSCQAMLPACEGEIEPLHGIYSRSVLPALEGYLAEKNKYAIRDFLRLTDVRYFYCEDIAKRNVFININSREDLESYLNT